MASPHAKLVVKVSEAERLLQYQFKDRPICWEALQVAGSGIMSSGGRIFDSGNKRLAILGDTVLKTILAEDWYESGEPRVQWTRVEQQIVANSNLHRVGLDKGFEKCVNVNPLNPVAVSRDIMATTVEALIGAIYVDSGKGAVEQAMKTLGLDYESALNSLLLIGPLGSLSMEPPIRQTPYEQSRGVRSDSRPDDVRSTASMSRSYVHANTSILDELSNPSAVLHERNGLGPALFPPDMSAWALLRGNTDSLGRAHTGMTSGNVVGPALCPFAKDRVGLLCLSSILVLACADENWKESPRNAFPYVHAQIRHRKGAWEKQERILTLSRQERNSMLAIEALRRY